ncbi:hypothetical protein [Thermomonospora umbrina]|uniref:Secreted protein n=1 Tax=Thermomonospora umbrina TaxID=111806 RepID=A0A3D9SRR0_9ACTN|nr:hypothetical protein [Thermomonospora umbrina]REE97170.1 hypothetical protein DFJ69_2628 [Thermomonospora umbrina]
MTRKYLMMCVAVVSAATLLTGCGGDDPESAPTRGGGDGAGSQSDQMVAYARCLRGQGVNVPDPDPGAANQLQVPKGVDPQKMSSAQQACRASAPQGLGGGTDSAQHDQMVAMARCLREHGVNVADPQPGEALRLPPGGSRDTRVREAMRDCQGATPTGGR